MRSVMGCLPISILALSSGWTAGAHATDTLHGANYCQPLFTCSNDIAYSNYGVYNNGAAAIGTMQMACLVAGKQGSDVSVISTISLVTTP